MGYFIGHLEVHAPPPAYNTGGAGGREARHSSIPGPLQTYEHRVIIVSSAVSGTATGASTGNIDTTADAHIKGVDPSRVRQPPMSQR